jgi:C-terminal processing protease CtpA/Prc
MKYLFIYCLFATIACGQASVQESSQLAEEPSIQLTNSPKIDPGGNTIEIQGIATLAKTSQ